MPIVGTLTEDFSPEKPSRVFVTDLRTDYERTATISVRVSDGENTIEAVSTVNIAAKQAEIDNILLASLITRESEEIRDSAPVLRLSAPYSVIDYGESIRLTASALDPEGSELKYLWLVDDQRAAEGASAYLDFSRFPEKGRDYQIKVAVSDGQNVTSAALKNIRK